MTQTPPPNPPAKPILPVNPVWHGSTGSLQAPWRLEYLESLSRAEPSPSSTASALAPLPSGGSFLADYWRRPELDERHHVIVRLAGDGDSSASVGGMILLNGFPYANGHLLVALSAARGTLIEYTPAERAALWRLTDAAAALMQAGLEPQGINIGINQGRAAGAGVPQHLHVHLVPRWSGDVNFMSVVADIRVIPSSLDSMARRYRAAWDRIKGDWLPQLRQSPSPS